MTKPKYINDRIFLNWMADVKKGSIKNFSYHSAKTEKGAIEEARKKMKRLEALGMIRPVEYYFKAKNPCCEVFYYPTKDGLRYIGREDEYKYIEMKSNNEIQHKSMEVDMAVSFVKHYTNYQPNGFNAGYKVEIEYEPDIFGKKPDIFINLKDDTNHFKFWVEVEKKYDIDREVDDKVKIFNSLKPKLPKQTRLLIVLGGCNHAWIYPQAQQSNLIQVERLNRSFNNFIRKKIKNYPPDVFFMNYLDYYRLNEAVWYQGGCATPRKLIQ